MPRTKDFEPAEALDRQRSEKRAGPLLSLRRGRSRRRQLAGVQKRLKRVAAVAGSHDRAAPVRLQRAVGLEPLERYSQAVMDPMIGALEDPRASAAEIRGFFDRVLGLIRRFGDRRGCLMCNAAFELGPVDSAAARRVRRHFARVRRLLARGLANARREGALSRDVAVPAYADHLLGAAAGAFFFARARVFIMFASA